MRVHQMWYTRCACPFGWAHSRRTQAVRRVALQRPVGGSAAGAPRTNCVAKPNVTLNYCCRPSNQCALLSLSSTDGIAADTSAINVNVIYNKACPWRSPHGNTKNSYTRDKHTPPKPMLWGEVKHVSGSYTCIAQQPGNGQETQNKCKASLNSMTNYRGNMRAKLQVIYTHPPCRRRHAASTAAATTESLRHRPQILNTTLQQS